MCVYVLFLFFCIFMLTLLIYCCLKITFFVVVAIFFVSGLLFLLKSPCCSVHRNKKENNKKRRWERNTSNKIMASFFSVVCKNRNLFYLLNHLTGTKQYNSQQQQFGIRIHRVWPWLFFFFLVGVFGRTKYFNNIKGEEQQKKSFVI